MIPGGQKRNGIFSDEDQVTLFGLLGRRGGHRRSALEGIRGIGTGRVLRQAGVVTGNIRQGTEGELQELWQQYHGDRLAAREIPEGKVRLEEIMFPEIQSAYEVVGGAPALRDPAFWIEISIYGGRFPSLDGEGRPGGWLNAA